MKEKYQSMMWIDPIDLAKKNHESRPIIIKLVRYNVQDASFSKNENREQ